MLTNFHTHNYRCKHAVGTAFDYVSKAIEENYQVIGLSDHAPLKYYPDRMHKDELPGYLAEVNEAKKRYGDQIKIYSGLEVEYFPELQAEYLGFLEQVDYLVLGHHDFFYNGMLHSSYDITDDQQLGQYFLMMFEAIKTGYFRFVAHPDLFGFNYSFTEKAKAYTHQLAKLCLEENLILEFNANGLRRGKSTILGEYRHNYPYKAFWEVVSEYKVKVIVNSDCHHFTYLNDTFDQQARELAKSIGLNVVDTIF